MSEQDELLERREEKLHAFKEKSINPFPSKTRRDTSCAEASLYFDKLGDKEISLAGRIKLLRLHGGSCFMTIDDGSDVYIDTNKCESACFQLFFSKKDIGADKYAELKLFDVGDFIEATGTLFLTKRGEQTLFVKDFNILTKSLRPLPEKWHGLKDIDERYRSRELDLISNKKVKQTFFIRSKIIQEFRKYLENEGFIEVETPVLQVTPGGATAKPFITHHNAYDIDMYLRIAPELYLKRLVVGGFDKVFEIGRQFRNEGVDREHNPEFTSLEFYWAYKDYTELMEFTERMISTVVKNVLGTESVLYEEQELNFKPPFARHRFHELILAETGINILKTRDEAVLKEAIAERGFAVDKKAGYAKLVDDLYKDAVRPKLIQPCFVIDHPIELEPLAKKSEENPELVERFQLLINGFEILKAYSELNDPKDQLERFEKQQKLREQGDEEAQFIDYEFVKSLEYGLPPTAGWGMGVDRLVTLLTDSHSLREVILFPTMKPKDGKEDSNSNAVQKKESVIANEDDNIDPGITRDEAIVLINEKVKTENSIKHMLATEAIMRALAKKLGQNEEAWGLAGLLHDADMEMKEAIDDPSKQGVLIAEELTKKGIAGSITGAIKAHNDKTGEPRDTLIKKVIFAVDPLTGLIVTTALVRPDKKLASVEPKSLKKKFKDKSFAKGARRDAIKTCEDFGVPLDEFLEIGLSAMTDISDELCL